MRLPGQRVIKTTISVFLTAYICVLLDWPPVFAVITAIVTIEPTARDSFQKGLVRFPASAIGSFFAVLFISLFGNSPLTYTLAASLTIIVCYQLRLYAGLLVATITAVAMVEVVYDNFVLSFLIRLGTTTTGIVVSTLVNTLILPPNYTKQIEQKFKEINRSFNHLFASLDLNKKLNSGLPQQVERINHMIDKTKELIKFQHDQMLFQATLISKKEVSHHHEKELEQVKLVQYHLKNISSIDFNHIHLSEAQERIIKEMTTYLATKFESTPQIADDPSASEILQAVLDIFWNINRPESTKEKFPDDFILLYEIISIFYILNENKSI